MSLAASVRTLGSPSVSSRPTFRGVRRVFEHNLIVYRRTWRGTLFSTVLSPVLFLTSMGIGLGGYVDRNGSGALAGATYLVFLAPGLLAAGAMQVAAGESTWPIMSKIVWQKNYQAMLATPLAVADLLFGEFAWITFRLAVSTAIFFLVMVLFGAVRSPEAVLAVPAAMLTGLAFAVPIVAYAATQHNDSGFSAIFRFLITPLFLLSGTFFPVERLPALVQPVAWVTPLYHGVALTRSISLGTVQPIELVHVGVLLAFIAAGIVLASLAYRRRLLT